MSDPSPIDEEEVFQTAVALPADEKAAYLGAICEGYPEIHARIERLLAAHVKNEFMVVETQNNGAGIETELACLKPEEEGERIGPYKLLQQIGEGGFGTVWVADQERPVQRRVALKIIKLGMNTKEVIGRFEQERQALALMDHPNIAKILDAGVTQLGRPFFVMELVRGLKITDYCDDRKLSTKERIEIFITVCRAVQHAHQKGIIHRDIKPSNILVAINDGDAVPKVIDFGVAKATLGRLSDQTVYTQLQQMIGTPLYMSPEQADLTSLDIDTRSDIYALGVLLYELLTGHTPIEQDTLTRVGLDEIRRLIREVDPPRPSMRMKTLNSAEMSDAAKCRNTEPAKLSGTLRGDLDWIVMKCIEKDRARRYDTANGLALDLRRHLANEVITAHPPTTAYLLGKLIRRQKLAFAAGTAIAASLVFGIAVSVSQAKRAVAALDELRATAPAFAEQAHALAAKERFDEAIEKLDYAVKLRPDAAEYLVAKGDLLQSQLKLAEAAAIYREALRIKPDLARAETSATLCDDLLTAKPNADGRLTRESLAKLHLAMQQQQRPAAEIMPVARLLGEEKELLVEYWFARIKDLPVSAENPLAKRLTVRDDGRLALDLSDTKVRDLSPLAGAPLATLDISKCKELTDLSPLRGLDLTELNLSGTSVADLTALREMHTLEKLEMTGSKVTDLAALSALRLKSLNFQNCPVSDLNPIRKMSLEEMNLRETRVADLSPLVGMPIKSIDLSLTPVVDFSPLAQLPLENCYLQYCRITDLALLRGKPLKELVLWACLEARNYAVLTEIKTLELLMLPFSYRDLPADDYAAIGSLRDHPKLRQIGADAMNGMGYAATGSKDVFWYDWDREQTFVPALRANGLKFTLTKLPTSTYSLSIQDQPLRDLSILKGAPISELNLANCPVSDLTPIHDMKLEVLLLASDSVADLSPLRGMPLTRLLLNGSKISDLSSLEGLPLRELYLDECKNVTDVAALAEIPTLEKVTVPMQARNIEALHKLTKLQLLAFNRIANALLPATTVEDFWEETAANSWIRRLREAGLKAKMLKRLEDGTWNVDLGFSEISDLTTIRGAPISGLFLGRTAVSDLAPLRGMPLKVLHIWNTGVADLSPLKGMPLIELSLARTKVADLSALRGMPLNVLWLSDCPDLTDLSPLADCKELRSVTLPSGAKNFEFLRTFPKIERLGYVEDPKNGYLPDKTAAEFWKEYDEQVWLRVLREAGFKAKILKRLDDGTWKVDLGDSGISDLTVLSGAPISSLWLGYTAVADLSPLRGMPLKQLELYGTKVSDLSPLQGMPIDHLNLAGTKVADLSVLRGMPLISVRFYDCGELTDLSPLADCKELQSVTLPSGAKNFEFLRTLPKLERIGFNEDTKNGWRPDRTAAEFWKEYDATKK